MNRKKEVINSVIEKEVTKLIDDIMEEVRKDFLQSKSDLDSYLFGLELITNLYQVLCNKEVNDIISIEYAFRNGDIYTLHEKIQDLL